MRTLLINTILLNQDHTNYCSIIYNGLRDLTYQNWQGKISEEELEKGYHSSLDVLTKTACPSVINDCSALSCVDTTNLNQLTEQWLRAALNKGVKYVAHVTSSGIPQEPFQTLQANARQMGQCDLEIFDNVDEALVWISFKNEFEGI